MVEVGIIQFLPYSSPWLYWFSGNFKGFLLTRGINKGGCIKQAIF